MSLKVIAGILKGRNIKTLPGLQTRPLLARVKKSLFDILTPKIVDSCFLDLFAGFGSVGIEALSRGAREVVFVENDAKCIRIIENNLETFAISEKAKAIQADAAHPELLNGKFDIIFVGPPYGTANLPDIIGKTASILADKNGLIIAQHHIRQVLPEKNEGLSLYRKEKYGDMQLSFFTFSQNSI
ncbi:MAG: 16S rRNA (guanine(966)-N(2))-methyltransferase RsmD [Elusimicrobia bacterium]|nr:16S rRNA (guanine(966)-N(2))-methyltransferase RsmD [Elusimicrobiota bacterium]